MQAQAIDYRSYDNGYEEGYNAALEAVRRNRTNNRYIREYVASEKQKAKAEQVTYFLKQRLAGLSIILASLMGIVLTNGEFGIAAAAIPVGIFVCLTRHRLFS